MDAKKYYVHGHPEKLTMEEIQKLEFVTIELNQSELDDHKNLWWKELFQNVTK